MVQIAEKDREQQALSILCGTDLEHMVEMVISSPSKDHFHVRNAGGSCTFTRVLDQNQPCGWSFAVENVSGKNPLENQDPYAFSPLSDELAQKYPSQIANSYPLAFERIAQVFDHPCAPDLCVLHTAAHKPFDHRGEHGSLDVVQSRAPLIASGKGIKKEGLRKGFCRMIDVAPSVVSLLGYETTDGIGPNGESAQTHLKRQDGKVLQDLFDGTIPDRVIVVLFDGANANVLYEAARSGIAPSVQSLIDAGTALEQGCLASLPTVTLANHTTLNTGAHPGHHGVLHNAWYDRKNSRQVVTESPATWQESMQWLFDGVETIHESIHRRDPEAVTISINEPADRGATYSTMGLMRDGQIMKLMEGISDPLPHGNAHYIEESNDYKWASMVDESALVQASAILDGTHLGVEYESPRFMWVSFSLTDAAFHEGGPYSDIAKQAVLDTDQRLGELLSKLRSTGLYDSTAVFLVADHGMEENHNEVIGDWGTALRAAGIEHRDEASGFLYLGETPDPK